jgi:hypothetical protein
MVIKSNAKMFAIADASQDKLIHKDKDLFNDGFKTF